MNGITIDNLLWFIEIYFKFMYPINLLFMK